MSGDEYEPPLEVRDRFISELTDRQLRIVIMLNAQVRLVVFFERIGKAVILSDPYFRKYIFGAFDGSFMKWGDPIRRKIGPPLIEEAYVRYLSREFCMAREQAHRHLVDVWAQYHDDPQQPAFYDGGNDALLYLGGGQPLKLAKHFGYGDGPLTQADVSAFARFMSEQDDLPTL